MSKVTFSAPQSQLTQGAVLMALAVLMFACMDVTTKHMSLTYAVPMIVFLRYAGNLLALLAVFGPSRGRQLFVIHRRRLVLLRSACLASSSLFAALAFHRMPVAEAVSIVFLAPFGVMLLAGPLLGEKVGLLQWLAALAGVAGVVLIARPGSGLDPYGVVFALITAASGIVYNMLSRSLSRSETTEAMLVWTALVGTLVFGAALPWFLPKSLPSLTDCALFAAMGCLATAGHFLFTQSFRVAPASFVSPINYLQLVWSGILGLVVFGHMPDLPALAGMALIALGGVSAALWPALAALLRRQPAAAAQPVLRPKRRLSLVTR